MLKLSDFQFDLPEELIAQQPADRRDASRLMLVDRVRGSIEHLHFHNITDRIHDDDLFVLNDTRVFPARLMGKKEGGQSTIELFLLRELSPGKWEALLKPARRVPPGSRILFGEGELEAEVLPIVAPGQKRHVRFNISEGLMEKFEELGEVPLPPYIRRPGGTTREDRERYQTVYAAHQGSVAAPTAGLHFTPDLLGRIRNCRITLHVGYGTFKPVIVENVADHVMDEEYFTVPEESALLIQRRKESGGRVIAAGTTSARTLEAVAAMCGKVEPCRGKTDLFIYPGYRFRVIDGLLTNFHLPGSTLLMLVSAFGGIELIREAYRQAIAGEYRFYSYGDVMLIL